MEEVRKWVQEDRTLVCLQADSNELFELLNNGIYNKSSFVDEDLDNMLTACAFGPMTKVEGDCLFGHLKLA
jgi:hypothetical protein